MSRRSATASTASRIVGSSSRRSQAGSIIPPLPSPPFETAPVKAPFLTSAELSVLVLSCVVKVLLFPAYHSTDFEVHRNWLAITHSLPLSQWYFDTTSEWTLDYPPFFAYFERILSSFAYVVDPRIVELGNLGYEASSAVAFQRGSVIISELVLGAGLLRWARGSQKPDHPTAFIIGTSIFLHPGLLIVDHIHFQYNGFLLGILLWSLISAREGNMYLCAVLFATLLNFKHLFIYLAPPFFVFLLRRHCFSSTGSFQSDRLVELGVIVTSIFTISFGPFLLAGGLPGIAQIFKRLFPFQRGLNHAYWAGNVWAVYSAVDRVLVKYLISRGFPISSEALISSSRGLIGTATFGVLPTITPTITFSITLAFTIVFLSKLWFDPTYKRFLDCVTLSAMTSFLWGWHVHEKAVLLFLIPLSLSAVEDDDHFRSFVMASCAGIYGLFPLLIKPAETPIKFLFSLIWCLLTFTSLRKVVYRPNPNLFSILLNYVESIYLWGFFAIQLYVGFIHEFVFPSNLPFINFDDILWPDREVPVVLKEGSGMEFLPLMLISLYCSVGIIGAWLRLSWSYFKR